MSRNRLLWALALLNAGLLTGLVWKLGGENEAHAQIGGRRAEYLMVPGRIPGAQNGVMYMVDTNNGLLSAYIFDQNRKAIDVMEPIDLNRIMQGGAVNQPNRGGGRGGR